MSCFQSRTGWLRGICAGFRDPPPVSAPRRPRCRRDRLSMLRNLHCGSLERRPVHLSNSGRSCCVRERLISPFCLAILGFSRRPLPCRRPPCGGRDRSTVTSSPFSPYPHRDWAARAHPGGTSNVDAKARLAAAVTAFICGSETGRRHRRRKLRMCSCIAP